MNLTTAAMLLNKSIRPVKVEYDPDNYKNNSPHVRFKTIDQTIKKDDLVVVTTGTRHGFTVAKVLEVDFPVDFNSAEQWGWIIEKVNLPQHKAILETESKIVARVGEVQENKMRAELKEAMGLGTVSFDDLDIMSVAQPTLAPPAPAPYEPPASPANPPARDYSKPLEDEIPF